MFWSGNYIVVRELNFLLKEENVTLSQVLEADDILQECKADNKNLMQFLTRPDILAELVTLITEEPPPHVELTAQYRHASIACEVLTSHLSSLSDRLSMDVTQMNRLCDFLNKEPPLNPLLASYFSKTIEMLLERSPKQDWYLYHIVCLRVLDFFKSRRDFLPNLLRHMSTSAIADTFKYFIRLDDLFNKIIMEWFEEHQLLESLVQVVCGTYAADDLDRPEKGQRDASEKQHNHLGEARPDGDHAANSINSESVPEGSGRAAAEPSPRQRRLRGVAAANAAALLCDVVGGGCAGEGCAPRGRTAWALAARLRADSGVRLLLQAVFTSPAAARAAAVLAGCRLLLALLARDPAAAPTLDHAALELALAPHLPLLHHALLHDPRGTPLHPPGVGLPRVTLAALLAQLAGADHEDVCTTLLTLGTPGVLVDMMFSFPHNNFLHAQVHAFVRHALNNASYRALYARHLLLECDLLTRLMDVFEENENKKIEGQSGTRSAYMGHVVMMLESIAHALDAGGGDLARELTLPDQLDQRWQTFSENTLRPLLLQRHTPLGGYYPSENIYEVENMADTLAAGYDFNDMAATANLDEGLEPDDISELQLAGAGHESADFAADSLGLRGHYEMENAKSRFLELANQRVYDDDTWECAPEDEDEPEGEAGGRRANDADLVRRVQEVLADGPLWDSPACSTATGGGGGGGGGGGAAGGWASFSGDAFAAPVDPFAAPAAPAAPAPGPAEPPAGPVWPPPAAHLDNSTEDSLDQKMRALRLEESLGSLEPLDKPLDDAGSVELANNLLHAMSHMAPHDLANIVNANLDLPLVQPHESCLPLPSGTNTTEASAGETSVGNDMAADRTDAVDSSNTADDKTALAADTTSAADGTGDRSTDAVVVDSNANTASSAASSSSDSCAAAADSSSTTTDPPSADGGGAAEADS